MSFKPAIKDLFVVGGGVLLTYTLSLIFNLAESFNDALAKYEHLQLDEIPFALFVLSILSAWYSHRRLVEITHETQKRQLAEHALAESQHLYKTLFDGSLTGNFVLDSEGNIEMFNEAFANLCGKRYEKNNIANLFGSSWAALIKRLEAERQLNFPKLRLARSDALPCFVTARLIYNNPNVRDPSLNKIHGYFSDITELCLAELDLEKALIENKKLSQHAMKTQEDERKYIAREIHDETGQYLSAIRMDALAIKSNTKVKVVEISQRIAANADHVQKTIKALLKYLRPPALDSRGLTGAVEHLIFEWQKLHPEIIYELSNSIESEKLSEEVNIVAYRIIQESLTNCAKHANAKWVKVKLCVQILKNNSCLLIEIRDDGQGIIEKENHTGLGLVGMRERVESVHGEFKLLSGNNAGTLISAQIPITLTANFTQPNA